MLIKRFPTSQCSNITSTFDGSTILQSDRKYLSTMGSFVVSEISTEESSMICCSPRVDFMALKKREPSVPGGKGLAPFLGDG
mmetsp:Transcript_15517/g.38646  ORF Transcript_15517/g.38646 Transcript_15517/m.38646 type:complete len:82 (+) Transcript_15517:964-1209(+)